MTSNFESFEVLAHRCDHLGGFICPQIVQSRQIKCDRLGETCIKDGEEETMKMRSGLDVSRRILQAIQYKNYDAFEAQRTS